MPIRIQRKRLKGWRMPLNTISVTRPGKYGNRYYPGCGIGYGYFDENMQPVSYNDRDPRQCVHMFRIWLREMKDYRPKEYEAYLAPLLGKNLACFCKPDQPCHADVLLELANPPLSCQAMEEDRDVA